MWTSHIDIPSVSLKEACMTSMELVVIVPFLKNKIEERSDEAGVGWIRLLGCNVITPPSFAHLHQSNS